MPISKPVRPLHPLHPLHAILLGFPLSLFLGALLSDLAYWATLQVQWANLSSWLIAGGLLIGVFTLIWALVILGRSGMRSGWQPAIYFISLLALLTLAFFNALVHAKDAWAIMPESLYLSAGSTFLALCSAWIGYSGFYAEVE